MGNNIQNIDKNFNTKSTIEKDGLSFYNAKNDPFCVYGLYDYKKQEIFRRLPEDVAIATNEGVAELSKNTAGGRVRFSTDSKVISISVKLNTINAIPNMPTSGTSGFDLFVDSPDGFESRYAGTFMPPVHAMEDGFESAIHFKTKKQRYITINFPTYSGVSELLIGISSDAALGEGLQYKNTPPIVYYGSSITQGACASRSGNNYQNIICRHLNMDYINLGFAGSGRGEDAICDYMASLKMSAFVSDYDHNAPTVEHLENTHYKLYQKIRAAHPDIPYIMISKCDIDSNPTNLERRLVISESYKKAVENGDNNVYYIDGSSVYRGRFQGMCTVDNIHPNDLGFSLLAEAIEGELQRAFTQSNL